MAEILENLRMYFSFSFVVYAFIAGTMIAVSSSLLGVTLVIKRFSYIGDGLSHVAFGAMAVASVFKLTNITLPFFSVPIICDTLFVLPMTILCAILILCADEKSRIKGDASVAMISVGALALGYFLMNIFSPPANLSGDVCSTLFGSTLILTLTKLEMMISVVLSSVVILFFIFFYNRIFSVVFDEDFSRASGFNARLMNVVMAVIIASVIVLAMNLVGTLLVSALIIFPAVSSMLVFKSFRNVVVFACIFSVASTVVGLLVSVISGTPVGSTIVIVELVAFAVCKMVSCVRR